MPKTIKRDIDSIAKASLLNLSEIGSASSLLKRAAETQLQYKKALDDAMPKNDLQKEMEAYHSLNKALNSSSVNQAAKALQDMVRQSDIYRLQKDINSILRSPAVLGVSDAIKQHGSLMNALVAPYVPALTEVAKLIHEFNNMDAGLALRNMVAQHEAYTQSLTLATASPLSAMQIALEEYNNLALASPNTADYDASLESLIDHLDASVPDTANSYSPTAIRDYISIVIAILTLLYAVSQSISQSAQDERHHNQIMEVMTKKQALLEELVQQYGYSSAGRTIYTVVRFTPLSSEQSFHHSRIMWLYPNQEVEAIDFDGKWVKVQAYDIQSAEIHQGWVLKKYMRLKKR